MPWKDNNKIWFNPVYVHSCCVDIVKKKGIEQIKKERNFKKLTESYDLSLVALAIYRLNDDTHGLPLIQIPKNDPPDGYIGQESKVVFGDFDISVVELTRYNGKNQKTLLKQLVDSGKFGKGYEKYSKEYILVIKVEEGVSPDYEEVNSFLKENNIMFAIWAIQITQTQPDTIVKLVILNPQIQTININIGGVALEYKIHKIPDVQEINRVGSQEKVRKELGSSIDKKYSNPEFGWIIE